MWRVNRWSMRRRFPFCCVDWPVRKCRSPSSAEALANRFPIPVRLRDVQMLQIGIGAGNAIDAEALGVAFPIVNEVASVAAGTPAESAGLRPGDRD